MTEGGGRVLVWEYDSQVEGGGDLCRRRERITWRTAGLYEGITGHSGLPGDILLAVTPLRVVGAPPKLLRHGHSHGWVDGEDKGGGPKPAVCPRIRGDWPTW